LAVTAFAVGCMGNKDLAGKGVAPCGDVTTPKTRFDAFKDFSFQSNPVPGGAWRYGFTVTLGGTFQLYHQKSTFYNQQSTLPISSWNAGSMNPDVNKNENGMEILSNQYVIHPASEYLNFHPGRGGEKSVVRWTCPKAGTYGVDAGFRSLRNGGQSTTTDIHVLKNGVSLFEGAINGHYADGEQVYNATLDLAACDTVDFVVGAGPNNDYICDSSGIRAKIEKAQR